MEVFYMGTVQRIALALVNNWRIKLGSCWVCFDLMLLRELAGGSAEPIARLIYIVIGVAGLLSLGLTIRRVARSEIVAKV